MIGLRISKDVALASPGLDQWLSSCTIYFSAQATIACCIKNAMI